MVEERSARWVACIYIIHDDGDVTVTATEFEDEELLDNVKERIRMTDPMFDTNPDQIQGFVIHPKTWPWLQNINWPKPPYDDFDPDWSQTVAQCKLSVYMACKV